MSSKDDRMKFLSLWLHFDFFFFGLLLTYFVTVHFSTVKFQ
jgi:hypothetical protein